MQTGLVPRADSATTGTDPWSRLSPPWASIRSVQYLPRSHASLLNRARSRTARRRSAATTECALMARLRLCVPGRGITAGRARRQQARQGWRTSISPRAERRPPKPPARTERIAWVGSRRTWSRRATGRGSGDRPVVSPGRGGKRPVMRSPSEAVLAVQALVVVWLGLLTPAGVRVLSARVPELSAAPACVRRVGGYGRSCGSSGRWSSGHGAACIGWAGDGYLLARRDRAGRPGSPRRGQPAWAGRCRHLPDRVP